VTRGAIYDDVVAAAANAVAELIAGVLHLSPRPAGPHTAVTSALGEELGPPFKRGAVGRADGSSWTSRSSISART
jgi:hypothetical protein